MLRPLKNKILFSFLNTSGSKFFHEETHWGFKILGNPDDSSKKPRWALVLAIGPDVDEQIKVNSFILIEPLMWTNGFDLDGIRVNWTDDSKVMLISDKKPSLF